VSLVPLSVHLATLAATLVNFKSSKEHFRGASGSHVN
jgi:hypothetical protein